MTELSYIVPSSSTPFRPSPSLMKHLVVPILILTPCLFGCPANGNAQSSDPPPGTWSGEVTNDGESKALSLRFEWGENKKSKMFLDLPDLKFRNLGPVPFTFQNNEYIAPGLGLRFSFDRKSVSGTWTFDGHVLPFKLKPGPLPPVPLIPETIDKVAQPLWTFRTEGAIWSSPAAFDGVVYFGSADRKLYAVRAASGKVVWQFKTNGSVMGKPTIDKNCLYALSDDGFLYKIQLQGGKEIWKFDTHGGSVPRDLPGSGSSVYDYSSSGATIQNGLVYIGSADKKLYAIDDGSGRERWHFDTQDIVRSTPALADGRVFFGSRDHNIYALDATTGALHWKFDSLREVVSSPLVANGTVYIGSRSSDLFALDAATGKLRWKYFYWSSWVESSAPIREGVLYVGSSDSQQLFAIDAETGKRIWNFDTNGSDWPSPAVTDKRVYIGAVGVLNYLVDHRGGFFAVDRAKGTLVWKYPMQPVKGSDLYGVASSPEVYGGRVYFGGLDGVLYAFPDNK